MADRSISVRLLANVTGLVSGFKTAERAAKDFGSRTSGYISRNEQHIGTLTTALGAVGIAAVGAAGLAVKRFADFDEAMSNVQASTMETVDNMALLREAALDAGARTVYSATEASAAIEELAKAGVSTADILGGGLDGALDLAAAGGIAVAEAAETAASAMTQFGLSGQDVTHIADLLAAGAGKAQGGVSDMGQALAQAGLVSSQMGLSIEETVGSLTAFASAGLIGSDAGTSFRAMLLRLANPTGESARLMEELGISVYDTQGNFIGMEGLAGQLQDRLGGLTQETRNQALAQIFGQDAIRTSAILYEQGAEGIREWTEAVDETGYASDVAATRLDNLKGDLEQLGGALETALIRAGEGADGPLRMLTQNLTDVVDAFSEAPSSVQGLTLAIVGGGGLVALGVAGLGKLVVGVNNVKTSMQAMGISAKTASIAVGAVGLALGVGAIALTTWAQNAAAARARTEELQGTLDEFGDVTDATLSKINESLSQNRNDWFQDAVLGRDPRSLIDIAEKYGLVVEDLQGYILGQADAVERVNGAMENYVGTSLAITREERKRESQAEGFIGVLNGEANALTDAQKAAAQKALADEAAGIASKEHAEAADEATRAMDDAARAAEAQASELQRLIDLHREMTDQALAQRDAQRGYEKALDDATEALETNGKTLDITTQKGRDNEAALDRIAAAGVTLIDNLREQGVSQEELQGKMQTTRDDFIAVAEQMGLSETAASDLADQLGLIPAEVKVDVDVETETAKRNIANFIATWDQKTIDLYARLSTSSAGLTHGAFANRAQGGYVSGPGTSTSDSIHARLSDGEYVVKAAAVSRYGRHLFDDLNQMRFATGGFVTPSGPAPVGPGAAPSLSLPTDGWSISGRLEVGGDGIARLVDGRLAHAQASRTAAVSRGAR